VSAGLTLDTGALIALERFDARALRLVNAARERDLVITVPASVLVEWWRGQRRAAAVLSFVRVEPLTDRVARTAGKALGEVGAGPSPTDAVVMASAATRGDTVITSDVADLDRLRASFPEVRLVRV
jgi:predicted nucleic acid-binding protein